MMSKNELKANHNDELSDEQIGKVGKYDVKERIESKSQLLPTHRGKNRVGKYDVKERIESKSQPKLFCEDVSGCWQI